MLEVAGLKKTYTVAEGQVSAVNSISIDVSKGEFVTLLGPSGCGKTTILRCVAGLELPDEGKITIGDNTVFSDRQRINVPVEKRDIGIVFQSYAIWPHMNVFENVAFPLRTLRQYKAGEIKRRVKESLRMVNMKEYIFRPAPQLSGGQQQRVALARALVRQPSLLLLDEPLSNLDAKLREETCLEIKDLVSTLGITVLYVTHDQAEALAMSDRILVMGHGVVLQEGAPLEIYNKPQSEAVANFIGAANLLEGHLLEQSGGMAKVQTQFGVLTCLLSPSLKNGDKVLVSTRPEAVRVLKENPHTDNVITGKITKIIFLGDCLDCRIEIDSRFIRAKLPPDLNHKEGERVFVQLPSRKALAIPRP